jgi:SAM-dependent methyltransferase
MKLAASTGSGSIGSARGDSNAAAGPLTDRSLWDAYWRRITLPKEIKPTDSLYVSELLRPLEEHLPMGGGRSALEIGGAPGGYLAYIHRRFGYDVSVLDYSEVGCELARENFRLLGIPAHVYQGDMFEGVPDLPTFDLVYSLGLVEHFENFAAVIEAHLRYAKPNGIVVVGCPNFLGVNGRIIERLSPSLLAEVELRTMDIRSWMLEERFGLEHLFLGYVGGFEPLMFWRCESPRRSDRLLRTTLTFAGRVLNRRPFAPLRRFNSRLWSGYAVGIYRVPSGGPPPDSAFVPPGSAFVGFP